MKLKNLLITSILVLFISIPGFAIEAPVAKSSAPMETPAAIRSQELIKRLEEIKTMDVESMTKAEKRKLRKEVKSIEREMRQINDSGGLYISVGGIIIILLLLILLL
jgi:hypothetical protein